MASRSRSSRQDSHAGGHAPKPWRASSPPRKATHMSSSRRTKRATTGWREALANLRSIGGAVLLALVIRVGLFESFEIDGPSMEPSLLNGERLVVGKYAFGLFLP